MRFSSLLVSCPERGALRAATLASLEASGWERPELVLDDQGGPTSISRAHAVWRRAVRRAGASSADFVVLMEDDLVFGKHFAHNVRSWPVLQTVPANGAFYGSLYNYGAAPLPASSDPLRSHGERHIVANPDFAWGTQAVVTTPLTARFIDANWDNTLGNADIRIFRLAALVTPIYFHVPSLVQHVGPSSWGATAHSAPDFDPDWRAARKPYEAPTVRDLPNPAVESPKRG